MLVLTRLAGMITLWAFLLLIPGWLQALDIPKDKLVKNREPGYCFFCCLEGLGNVYGIDDLKGLVDRREKQKVTEEGLSTAPGYPWEIHRVLDNTKNALYYYQAPYSNSRALLKYAKSNGVIIGYRTKDKDGNPAAHAVILVEYDEEHVEFYDTNDLKRYTASLEWMNKFWTGEALIIWKK